MEYKSKCSRCGRESAVELAYLGERLCDKCFTSLFEKRVRKTIRLNKLLRRDDLIGVALSGGKDSAVALYLIKHLVDKVPTSKIVAFTIDDGIKDYRKKSIKEASKLCDKLGVEHLIYSFKDEYGFTIDELVEKISSAKDRAPVCTYCGVLRRKLINDKGRELKLNKIITGHNLDDEVQTSLMNYIRGDLDRISRMGALVGVLMDDGFTPRIKPLRECPTEEIIEYARIKKIGYHPKSCPHSHEAFRQTIKEIINLLELKHPGSRFQILKSTDNLIDKLRKIKIEGKINYCSICGDPTSGTKCKACQILSELEIL